jgi:hypothetical protein
VPDRNLNTGVKVLSALAVLLLGSNSAMAYVGPGTDLTFISYAVTLLAWLVAAFSAVLLWPVYALLRRIRGRQNKSVTTSLLTKAAESVSGPTSRFRKAEHDAEPIDSSHNIHPKSIV